MRLLLSIDPAQKRAPRVIVPGGKVLSCQLSDWNTLYFSLCPAVPDKARADEHVIDGHGADEHDDRNKIELRHIPGENGKRGDERQNAKKPCKLICHRHSSTM